MGRVTVNESVQSLKDLESLMIDSDKLKELEAMGTRKSSMHLSHRYKALNFRQSLTGFINPREHNYARITDTDMSRSSITRVPIREKRSRIAAATPSLLDSRMKQNISTIQQKKYEGLTLKSR